MLDRFRASFAALGLLAAGAVRGQDLNPLLADLARAQERAARADARDPARAAVIQARQRLIDAAPDTEPRLPGWLIEHAADTLARLADDGSDTAAIHGIPLASQRDRAAKGAADALTLLGRADRLLTAAAEAIASEGIGPESPRAKEIEQDRNVRVPFFRARAELVLAGLAQGEARRARAQSAHQSISRLALASGGAEAFRRVTLAGALLLRSNSPADARSATDEIAPLLAPADAPPPGIAVAEAWFCLVSAAARLDTLERVMPRFAEARLAPPFVPEPGRADPLLIVLAADACARALMDAGLSRADRSPEAARALLDQAADEQASLLARTDLGLSPEGVRALAFEKLADLGARAPDESSLPAVMRLALAVRLATREGRAAEAVQRLESIASGGAKGGGPWIPDALWEWAVLLSRPSSSGAPPAPAEQRRAADVLLRLAREHASHPRAPEAIAAALAFAQSLALAPGATPEDAGRYRATLGVAVTSFPRIPGIDRWRYERARVLSEGSGEELREAIGLLRALAGGPESSPDAASLYRAVLRRWLDEGWTRVASARARGDDPARDAGEILATAREAATWSGRHAPESAPAFRLDLADALVETGGSAEAVGIYRSLRAAGGGAWSARVELGLGRALVASGDRAGGFAVLREVATRLDAPGSRGPAFWHAWTILIEQLAREGRGGTITAHVRRLRGLDADLGGEPWKARIERATPK
ncbi:MAG: hypothetical protein JNM80_09595 [Phycisphaerae bacterium]|nr:hypothetical protein [Phycisphaerae bacterium]